MRTNKVELHHIETDKLRRDEGHRPVDENEVAKLAQSIKQVGLLNPLLVTQRKEDLPLDLWLVIIGKHRFEACKRVGLKTIPCFLSESDNPLQTELAEIDENI